MEDKLELQQQILGMIPNQWYAWKQNRTVLPKPGNMFNKSCSNLVGVIVSLKNYVKRTQKNLLVIYNIENQKY